MTAGEWRVRTQDGSADLTGYWGPGGYRARVRSARTGRNVEMTAERLDELAQAWIEHRRLGRCDTPENDRPNV